MADFKIRLQALWRSFPVRDLIRVLVDTLSTLAALYVALLLRYDAQVPARVVGLVHHRMVWIVLTHVCCLALFGIYRMMWRYGGVREYVCVSAACATAAAINIALSIVLAWQLPRSVLIITAMGVMILVSITRLAWVFARIILLPRLKTRGSDRRILIVGAGEGGLFALRHARSRKLGSVVCMVDDDPTKQSHRAAGVPVLGTVADIPALVRARKITDIIIAIPSLKAAQLEAVGSVCAGTRCAVKVLSQPEDIHASGAKPMPVLKRMDVSIFLERDEVVLDTNGISAYVTGKTVLVTGGGGSIGSEICRQLMRFAPKLLVIFDIYENCAYELQMELKRKRGADCPVEVVIGSIRDKKRLDEVMECYRPQVLFHAAAHKHVPLMEVSPAEAVKNNVFGTYNVLQSAAEHHVERVVQLSTDKAVNPTNVMGATKRITEMLAQMFSRTTQMKCMAVRFGNVLGSHGSVIPLFEEMILDGGPVTLTHENITRYFMTIPEAARLVLQAGALAKSGSIYVLDMGEPVKIYDLAEKLIRFHGYVPGKDIEITVTGLRPGEKMYEELMMETEKSAMGRTAHDKIMVAPPIPMDDVQFLHALARLKEAAQSGDREKTIRNLKEIVGTYHPADSRMVS